MLKNFNKFGVMVDCSRNAVMTVDALKKFITIIGKMGYNQVHLYMEDTYEVDGEPQFGYLRGKYTKEELKELVDFAYALGIEPSKKVINPCKYMLYADCFLSIFQNLEKAEYAQVYTAFARKLTYAAKRAGEQACLFETMAKLCSVLEIKQDICTRTRKAYESGDMLQLDAVISDYKKMIKRTEAFYRAFRTQWYRENKPHGFDVQDLRIGGLLQRMRSCLDRLVAYRDGTVASIPELEETVVPFTEKHMVYNTWQKSSTINII